MANEFSSRTKPMDKKVLWAGRILSGIVALLFAFSGVMKFQGGEDLETGFAHLGLSLSMAHPLGILELLCVVIYAIPATAVLGAILLTGYLGGAICTHWRVGDPFFVQIGVGVFVWLGLFLREPRLWEILPLRTNRDS